MEDQIDVLAKSYAGAVTRRDAFRRVGKGLAAGVLAFLGLQSAAAAAQGSACGQCCATQCLTAFPPETFREEFALCVQGCLDTGKVAGFEVCTALCVP